VDELDELAHSLADIFCDRVTTETRAQARYALYAYATAVRRMLIR
jgi:hypothetical protein